MPDIGSMQHLTDRVKHIHSIAELEWAQAESQTVEPKRARLIIIHFNIIISKKKIQILVYLK